MAGTFSKSNRPKRPGAYFNFVARQPEPTIVNTLGTILVAFTHTWGPAKQIVELTSFGDFLATFGQGSPASNVAYSSGYRSIRDAFRGEDLGDARPGSGGAGKILAYRLIDSSAASATKSLSNGTTGAITLTAVYKGSYGNNVSAAVVADSVAPSTNANLVLYVEGVEVERFNYAKTNITDLAAQINGTTPYTVKTASDWVTAGSVTSGTALTAITATAFAGGLDGATPVAGDYTAAMSAFEPFRFSALTFDQLSDSTALTALQTWQANLNSKGKRFVTVVGGASGESMATAVTRAGTFNDPNVVNLGCGTYTDDIYGDVGTNQLTARLAGIMAQRGTTKEVTFARLAGLTVKVGPTEADILTGIAGGTIAIARDSYPVAPTRFELGITTYTVATDAQHPVSIYSNLKFVRVMHDIEVTLTEWAEENVIGQMQVNDATRDYIVGQMKAAMKLREADGTVLPGWSVAIDSNPPPSDTDNFIGIVYQLTLGRGLEQILNTVVVG